MKPDCSYKPHADNWNRSLCVQGDPGPGFGSFCCFIISSYFLLLLRTPDKTSHRLEGPAKEPDPIRGQPSLLQCRVPLPLPQQYSGVPSSTANHYHHDDQSKCSRRVQQQIEHSFSSQLVLIVPELVTCLLLSLLKWTTLTPVAPGFIWASKHWLLC